MRSIISKKKTIIILAISLFLVFNVLAISNVYGATFQEQAVFDLDKEDPLGPEGYGAIVPSPNTIGAVFVDGTNQGKFTVTDWTGTLPFGEEIVNYPGEDISLYYPTDLDNYWTGAMSLTDDIDPWTEVHWLNVSAYNAEADTLSPFTVSSAFDYYAMEEGAVFTKPFNYEKPMQIDLIVKSTGPKVLKLDWLTVNPALVMYMHFLVAPSGKHVDYYEAPAIFQGITTLYNYLVFTANEIGSYRLLIVAQHTNPASLNLEFLDIDIFSLPISTAQFGANFDDFGTLDISKTAMWQSNWFKISGTKGEVFRLDIYEDFSTGFTPTISIWSPSQNGYFYQNVGTGSHDIYLAKTGYAYISLTDINFGDWYRYSVLVTKASNEIYTLGDKTTFNINMDEAKTVEFTISTDSIVRFNYTTLPNPAGLPTLNSLGNADAFIYRDSAEFQGYDINSAIFTKTVDSTEFYWHYMPRGTYKAVIRNTNPLANGLFQISSQVYECSGQTIPVNNLKYPRTSPSNFDTIEFQPDDTFSSLKNPVGVDIEIPEIGQFRLNTTMWASENAANLSLATPSHVYSYIDGNFIKYNYTFEAFNSTSDYLYIAYTGRWTGMDISLSKPGVGGSLRAESYTSGMFGWDLMDLQPDGTNDLNNSGIMEFRETEDDFRTWVRGTGGMNIDDSIDENDYYWLRIDPTSAYTTYPIINSLQLTNITITGDINFVLIGESGYEFDDYWGPSGIAQPSSFERFRVSLDEEPDDFGDMSYDTEESYIIDTPGGVAWTNGFEAGTYRLIIIPEDWDYNGSVTINFAVENHFRNAYNATYDIETLTATPNLHIRDITNYTFAGYSNITGLIYDYGMIAEYNHTESYNPHTGYSYFALNCIGDPYQWTQLIATVKGLSGGYYNLQILQDLPWIDTNGPNSEATNIDTFVFTNTSYEFGVFSDHFTLLFEVVAPLGNNISFYISLSQYDTITLTTSDVKASYTPPLSDTLILALAIGIPAAVGAVVVIFVLKRKGKILTKRPS
jgi:hypothetical protein